jgi:protein-S-isoprenylcysteine O-methyltransferase Ste14
MYVGLVLMLAGIALALGSVTPWAAVLFFAWIVRVRFIALEESKLADTFGQRYRDYSARVRRWL